MEREEAIKIARKLYNDSLFLKKDKEAMVTLIPELKESNYEKISKALIKYFTSSISNPDYKICGVSFNEVVDWLEKQGEQKPTDKVEPKFKVGDKIYLKPEHRMPDDDTPIADTIHEIIAIDDKHYRFEGSFIFIKDQDKFELVEQNPADKVEPKFKVGDWITIKE